MARYYSDTSLRCRWCGLRIFGLKQEGRLGGMWAHVRTRREACGVDGRTAEPETVE